MLKDITGLTNDALEDYGRVVAGDDPTASPLQRQHGGRARCHAATAGIDRAMTTWCRC